MTNSRTGMDHVTARASCSDFFVLGVDTFFHGEPLWVMPLPDHGAIVIALVPGTACLNQWRRPGTIHALPETDRESYLQLSWQASLTIRSTQCHPPHELH